MTIVKNFDTEIVKHKIPKKYLVIFGLCFSILILLEVWAINTMISFGKKFDEMVALEHALETENQVLENEIAQTSALSVVATRAAELGFLKAQSIQYIR